MNSAGAPGSFLGRVFGALTRWAWLPAPPLALAILVLVFADLRHAYIAPPRLLFALQFTFMTLVSVAVAYLALRSFVTEGTRGFLLLGCGALSWGVSGVIANVASRGDLNTSVTVHNFCVWLSAFCHLTGVALPAHSSVAPGKRIWQLLGGMTATAAALALIAAATVTGWTPPFFVQGEGGTPVRQAVLGSAIAMFALSSVMLGGVGAQRSVFRRWYGLGLLLVALGLFGVLIQAVHSSVLGWTGVSTQWLGSVYLLVAVFAAVRQTGQPIVSLAGQPQDSPLRYAVAMALTFAGGCLAFVFLHNFSPHVAYLAVYPVVILAALYGGRGPGVLAAVVLVVGVDVVWLEPIRWFSWNDASDWVARGLFFTSSACMVLLVDVMQSARAATMRAEVEMESQRRAEESLKASNQAKDEFLAMLGHELRNPLGAIATATSLLNVASGAEQTAARARAIIARQVQLLSRLVDDLLDVSRVTSGKVVLLRKPIDLAELVKTAVVSWRGSDRLERHHVSVAASSVWVDADEVRVEQVVSNLVGNALKYTPTGGAVSIRVREDGKWAVVEVQDTGVGIPRNLVDRVFDLFVQGARTLDRSQGGLGIGLTLVKALVEMHGGAVAAASEGPGKGSTFSVRLPRIAARAPAELPVSTARTDGSPRRILVIEDNADAREMLRTQLVRDGHDLHEAADGATGLAIATSIVPDVALVDLGLPIIDGYEVARRIRATKEGKSILLVAVTGYGQAEDRRRAFEAGFDAHLTKPVVPARLAEVISTGRRRPAG